MWILCARFDTNSLEDFAEFAGTRRRRLQPSASREAALLRDGKMMAVDVKLGKNFEASIPRPLFELPNNWSQVRGYQGQSAVLDPFKSSIQ
jgi:hypothetical protein